MKEMVGGCCVCSDERGWDENPLVYCDGQGCNVAVHQACYGIVTVPSGPWFCRRCESQERSARVRCELCPSRDGALKKTDSNGWAHVVCALYIPEVRFGNVTTMEPILISLIPAERFNKTCYICDDKRERGSVGACMQCNKPGCKQNFHVTCAQYKGLLCEEAGNMMDNVKYCGYCDYHYGKLKKTSNMKIIPPFKPVPSSAAESPASSPEKNNQKTGSGTETPGSNQAHTSNANANSAASTLGENSATAVTNPSNISPDINSGSKNSASKPSLKKASSVTNNGKSGSSNNNNSGNSSSSSSTNPSPIPKIQPSNLFSSGAFSSSLGMNRHPSGEKAKIKPDEEGSVGKSGGSPDHSHRSGSGKFSVKTKDYTTLSMSDVVTAALDRPMASKFDLSNSANIAGGTEPSASQPATSTHHHHHRHDKPPPDIKPHVTLTPIPMRSSDEAKLGIRSSKSPALTFPSSFGQSSKFSAHQTSPELAEREKKSKTDSDLPIEALTPTKRTRHAPENYDSDTESASETWPVRQDEESESQSQTGSHSRTEVHMSRKERFLGGQQLSTSPARMLTPQQAQDMAHWESGRSPQVTLERMRLSSSGGREGSPFNPKMYTAEFVPKRGPGRPVKRRSGTSRDDDGPDTKVSSRSRGRRGGVSSRDNGSAYSRSKDNNVNSNGGGVDERENFDDPSMDPANLSVGTSGGRGGRHSGPGRKAITASTGNNLPKKPNYDEAPTMTFAQLKAQSTASSDKAPAHMFGNLLNPASSMAQKMVDSLSQEMETIAEVTENVPPQTQLVGITFPGRSSTQTTPINGTSAIAPAAPSQGLEISLEELLERQWEQGSQFLMEQAQHLDIAQLLSCLNQLKQDNRALEEHVASLIQRKEHLSAINARLSIPLGSSSSLVNLGSSYSNPATGNHGTPPLGSQANKNVASVAHNGSAVPSPQLQQQILQETAAHQSRIPTHPFPGTESMNHGHQTHHGHGHSHRTHNSGPGQGQVFGFPGHNQHAHGHGQQGGLPVPVVTSHPSPHSGHHPSMPMPRDSR